MGDNNDASVAVLDPDAQLTLSSGEHVMVRELTWKEAKKFLAALAGRAADFVKIDVATGVPDVDTQAMLRVITTDLGEELVAATTGKDAAWAETVTLGDFLAVLNKAVELNLRPEMIEAGKAIAGRFKGLLKR